MKKKPSIAKPFALLSSIILSAAALAMPARAQDTFYLTPAVGTLGVSVKDTYRWSETWAATGMISGFAYNRTRTYAGISASETPLFLNAGLFADYYPIGGNFHVTGGMRYSKDEVKGTVTSGGQTTAYTLSANKFQPYIGAGYSLEFTNRIALDLDAGAFYTGKSSLSTPSNVSSPQISNALSAATQAASSPIYPVVQIGLRFQY